MRSKEELNELKEEIENMKKKLAELSGDELKQVTGGSITPPVNTDGKNASGTFIIPESGNDKQYEYHIYKDNV